MHALINLTTLTKLALLSPLQGGNRGSWLSVYRSNQQPEEQVENDFTEGKGGDSHKGVKGHRRRIRQGLRSVLCIWQYEGRCHVHLSQHLQFGTSHTASATKSKFRCEIEPHLTQEKMGLQRGWGSHTHRPGLVLLSHASPLFFAPHKLFSKVRSRNKGQFLKHWYYLFQKIR